MKRLSSVLPAPYMTHEYSDAVLLRMMYCVRSAVNRWLSCFNESETVRYQLEETVSGSS